MLPIFISLMKNHCYNNVKLTKMALLIPKLRSQFAEFLNDCSLKRLCILYLLIGRYNLGTVFFLIWFISQNLYYLVKVLSLKYMQTLEENFFFFQNLYYLLKVLKKILYHYDILQCISILIQNIYIYIIKIIY